MIVNVFYDLDVNKFSGAARLIEVKEKGHTFIDGSESLLTIRENKSVGKDHKHLPLSKKEKRNNRIYNELNRSFYEYDRYSIDKDFKDVITYLKKMTSKKIESLQKVEDAIIYYQFKWRDKIDSRRVAFCKYSPKIIRDFLYQTTLKDWYNTLYRREKWVVEYIPEQYDIKTKMLLYGTSFRTTRTLAVPVCISPNEDAQNCKIRYFSTGTNMNNLGSSISNSDRKLLNLKPEEDEY